MIPKTIFEIKQLSSEERQAYEAELECGGLDMVNYSVARCIEDIIAIPEDFLPVTEGVMKLLLNTLLNYWDKNSLIRSFPVFNNITGIVAEELTVIKVKNNDDIRALVLDGAQICILNQVMASLNRHEYVKAMEIINQQFEAVCVYDEDIEFFVSAGLEDPRISLNSASLDVKDNTARFSSAIWYEAIKQKVITLAGVGGIGSYVAFLLARMKPTSIFIYDDDKVEAVNMSGQLYGQNDIGQYKVNALANMIANYADYHSVFAVPEKFTDECEASEIMICGFDNMAARKLFFEKWKAFVMQQAPEDRAHCLFIDGRLAAEELQVYCVTGDNDYSMDKYVEALFTDEEADETVCSYKQTTYMANMIGSIIVNLFTNFVANEMLDFMGRELPFFTSYSGLTMQFKIE